MNFLPLTDYVSDIDQFLQALEKRYPTLSASQKAEIAKYQRIFYLRDIADRSDLEGGPSCKN